MEVAVKECPPTVYAACRRSQDHQRAIMSDHIYIYIYKERLMKQEKHQHEIETNLLHQGEEF